MFYIEWESDFTNSFGGSKSLEITFEIESFQITKTKPKMPNQNFHWKSTVF